MKKQLLQNNNDFKSFNKIFSFSRTPAHFLERRWVFAVKNQVTGENCISLSQRTRFTIFSEFFIQTTTAYDNVLAYIQVQMQV